MTYEQLVRAIDEIEARLRKGVDILEKIMLRKARRDLWLALMDLADEN